MTRTARARSRAESMPTNAAAPSGAAASPARSPLTRSQVPAPVAALLDVGVLDEIGASLARVDDVSRAHPVWRVGLADGRRLVVKAGIGHGGPDLAVECLVYRMTWWCEPLAAALPVPLVVDEDRQLLVLADVGGPDGTGSLAQQVGFPALLGERTTRFGGPGLDRVAGHDRRPGSDRGRPAPGHGRVPAAAGPATPRPRPRRPRRAAVRGRLPECPGARHAVRPRQPSAGHRRRGGAAATGRGVPGQPRPQVGQRGAHRIGAAAGPAGLGAGRAGRSRLGSRLPAGRAPCPGRTARRPRPERTAR